MRFGRIVTLAFLIGLAGCASQSHRPALSPENSHAEGKEHGWYLMQPPLHHGNPDTSAQLADWYSIGFFDKSAQCDAARARGLSSYSSYVQVSSTAPDTVGMSQRLAASTLCVAADDPRINWFHLNWKWK